MMDERLACDVNKIINAERDEKQRLTLFPVANESQHLTEILPMPNEPENERRK